MKLMIDISDSTYDSIMARDWENAGWLFGEELKAIHNGTPIPDNATNGDVIKALFPSWKVEHVRKMSGMNRYECSIDSINYISFYDEWWNAPYKRGETG